ncbi:MAG: Asp-tRNA(Asn)/Glu-tRNA(Gln) amidotransferase GatCAB subunit B, partial [Ferruginibacter sp.]
KLNTRVEVKNLNSIRNVKKAIEVEIERLIELTENDQPIVQQTRSFDADTNTTFALRNKEEADDYRYFPEPDLPPFYLSQKYIQVVRDAIPVLPAELQKKYIAQYKLSPYDAAVICNDKEDADFFEQLVQHTSNYKAAANWMIGPLKSYCHEHSCGFSTFPLESAAVGGLIQLTAAGLINFKNASGKILQAMIAAPATTALQIATELNLLQESGAGIVETWVEKVIDSLPQKVKEYKSGKKNLLGLFAGEVKKISNGKADMQLVNKLLAEKLNN